MFAWALEAEAEAVRTAMVAAFKSTGLAVDEWNVPIEATGARVVA